MTSVSDATIRRVDLTLMLFLVFTHSPVIAQENIYHLNAGRLQEAIRSANAEKPIVVFFRPERCGTTRKLDACDAFADLLRHPAIQRRLVEVVFLTETLRIPAIPAVTVYDPAGNAATRWLGLPDATELGRMLNLIEGAAGYLAETARASSTGNQSARARASALASLALGDEARGRAGLETLTHSSDVEDCELATIWLLRIAPQMPGDAGYEKLAELGRTGATDHVRFEAWMAAGDFHAARDRIEDASIAYNRALDVASPELRKVALASRENLAENNSVFLGLGGPRDLVFGRRTIQPRAVRTDATSVELRLDGRLVATSKRAPFTTSVNFGRIPKRQVLSMVVVDKSGRKMPHSGVVVNERSDAFSVRIDEPAGATFSGSVDVVVSTHTPQWSVVESVVVEWNDVRIARFTSPPYRTRVTVRHGERGILRAAVRLEDGSETEDVRLVNSRDLTLESDINLIEVPAYFEDTRVTADTILVREAGRSRRVDRLIPASEAPLRIALVLDRSGSMAENLLDLEEAALRFVEKNISERDETMVVEFGSGLRVLAPTHDHSLIEHAILRMRPMGKTSLHDAMITALMRLQVSGWRRALVVFSDGMDTNSVFSARDVAEVARRIGVPIYVLSFRAVVPSAPRFGRNLPSSAERSLDAERELARISTKSGGKAFHLPSLEQLSAIWNEIGADLRKQALVIYSTDSAGDEWRPLEVSLKGGQRVRAPAGVYVVEDSPEAQRPSHIDP